MYVNILEIKKLKQKAEQTIEKILNDFEIESGCIAKDIKWDRMETFGLPSTIVGVDLDVRVK